ncbi:MAG: hypothetical protein WCC29_15870, partial [Pseudomonas farsensis]|uniref:hypothetical protein n=1 Tax=Pseudomonas farsensis TaxID=2745492 RepID=UPI003C7B8D2E
MAAVFQPVFHLKTQTYIHSINQHVTDPVHLPPARTTKQAYSNAVSRPKKGALYAVLSSRYLDDQRHLSLDLW